MVSWLGTVREVEDVYVTGVIPEGLLLGCLQKTNCSNNNLASQILTVAMIRGAWSETAA
jgi:hypothetical protein